MHSTLHPFTQAPRWLRVTSAVLYYLLIVCNILMQTLEIVRLSLIHFGIGLLPFTYVGLILGGALHMTAGFHGTLPTFQGINTIIWLGGMVMNVVKVAGLVRGGIGGRKGSKYLVSDQVIDVGVIAGVYAIIAVLEFVASGREITRPSKSKDSEVARHSAAGGVSYEK
jgi:hypothetical protein